MAKKIVIVIRYLKDLNIGPETYSSYSEGWDACADDIIEQLKGIGVEVEIVAITADQLAGEADPLNMNQKAVWQGK